MEIVVVNRREKNKSMRTRGKAGKRLTKPMAGIIALRVLIKSRNSAANGHAPARAS